MSTLPRQTADGTRVFYSLKSDNQLRTILEGGLDALVGHGVLSGGQVTPTAPFSVEVEAGTRVWSEGVLLTLDSAQSYSPFGAEGSVTLWAQLLRTARDRDDPSSVDSWSLEITHNDTDEAPSDLHFRMAYVVIGAGGILSIDSDPGGKYVGFAAPVSIGTANAEGTAQTFARSDHVHALPAGSVALNSLETEVAEEDALEEQARKFRRLLLWVGTTFNAIPPGLEEDFILAASE